MKLPWCFSAVVVLITYVNAKSYCSIDTTIGQIPSQVALQIYYFLTSGASQLVTDCSGVALISQEDVRFFLFNRTASFVLINTANPVQVDPSKPIKVLITGWLCNVTDGGMPEMKDAYLTLDDYNVIMVDWSKIAVALFTAAHCNVPYVGQLLGNLLCDIMTLLNVSEDNIQLIGFQLGAHIAGFAGETTKLQCNRTVGRIDGLDPLTFAYEILPENRRLERTDGKFVTFIHTTPGIFGTLLPRADVDFYVNCGPQQPGCPVLIVNNPIDLFNYSVPFVFCSHFRSVYLWIESILSLNFIACSCSACPAMCGCDPLYSSNTIMGQHCPVKPLNSIYSMCTNSTSPYAIGAASAPPCLSGTIPLLGKL